MIPSRDTQMALIELFGQTIANWQLTNDGRGVWLHFLSGTSALIAMPATSAGQLHFTLASGISGNPMVDPHSAGETVTPRQKRSRRSKIESLPEGVIKELVDKLVGGGSYADVRAWLDAAHGVSVSPASLSDFFRTHCLPVLEAKRARIVESGTKR